MTEQELENIRLLAEASNAHYAARDAAILEALPSWAQVETACDNISTLAEAKAFLKKLSRVVYWLAKNSGA